ncbi:hypothetical protein BCCH1_71930 [Burkholderia contaminans]|uniref:DUF4123 domain-containing protein n=2 Tax=Burkholderia contaminans TaxID=488447 RepID=A0A250LL79_9BURK|nr:hypothetical protein SK875_C00209 [Burkholderia contaminans]BBA44689.1 hypothetical protein BCCH1_71930 [Burkholderia contaminans]GLZ75120.1 hypothetical protein Bcon01_81650 [Burkholderia contaminans]
MLRSELRNTPWAMAGNRIYIVVDPLLGDPFHDLPNWKVPLPIEHESLRGAHRPYLMQAGLHGDVFERSVDIAAQEAERSREDVPGARTVCGWLFTSASASKVAAHLASNALLRSAERARLLRYWDPRVMDLMRAMLSPHQAHALMGLESGWYWTGRDKTLHTLTSRDEGRGLHTALHLTDEQIALLEQAPHINRVLDILQDTGHDVGAVDPLHLARCICQGRQAWAFSDEHEHVIYALHCVLVHEQFDRLPDVRNAMTVEVSQGRSAITALDRFDDTYWQSMANSQSRMGQA